MVRAGEHGTRRCFRSWDFSLEKRGLRRDVIATGRTKSCLAEALGHQAQLQSSPAGPGPLLGSWCAAQGSHSAPAWAGRHRRAASSPAPPAPAAGQVLPASSSRKSPTQGGSRRLRFPAARNPEASAFPATATEGQSIPWDELCAAAVRARQGCRGPLKRFKCSKGISRASLQISASPALSAGSGAALPGEKPCSWNSLHPRRTRRLAEMERGAGSSSERGCKETPGAQRAQSAAF